MMLRDLFTVTTVSDIVLEWVTVINRCLVYPHQTDDVWCIRIKQMMFGVSDVCLHPHFSRVLLVE